MRYYGWRPYMPVALRRLNALKKLAKLKERGRAVCPATVEGRAIAKSFWGKSWCANLERYSDFQNRLPRGRTYVRNGSVVDLQIVKSKVIAMVSGSDLYTVMITIRPVTAARWKAICRDCGVPSATRHSSSLKHLKDLTVQARAASDATPTLLVDTDDAGFL